MSSFNVQKYTWAEGTEAVVNSEKTNKKEAGFSISDDYDNRDFNSL